MNPKKVLLIGYGSIGKKHAANLTALGTNPYVLTKYPDNSNIAYIRDINEIKDENIDYCIISTLTAMHLDDLRKCLLLTNKPKGILIEKPLECSFLRGSEIKTIADTYNLNIFLGYNLRFLDIFSIIKDFIVQHGDSIRIVEVVCGQNLKDWRPLQKYEESYSADREMGGGVDLDLSHEIDYVLWLFGTDIKNKVLYKNKISGLNINSPDIFKLILDYDTFIVDITLDYIRKQKERYIKIICENGNNLYYDFVTSTLKIGEKSIELNDNIDKSYKEMLKAFLDIDEKNKNKLATTKDGLSILNILDM